MLGKCPKCENASTEDEWAKSESYFESVMVGNVYEPYGDMTKCPVCGEFVPDDYIDWE